MRKFLISVAAVAASLVSVPAHALPTTECATVLVRGQWRVICREVGVPIPVPPRS